MRFLGVSLAIMVAVSHLAADVETDRLAFRLFDHGAIVVPVSIDGRSSRPFLLDTGASRSVVADEVARRLGLPRVGSVTVATALGVQGASTVRLDRAAMGDAPPLDLTALVLPGYQLGRRAPVDGLIGQDVLAARVFRIDYRRRELVWLAAGAPMPAGPRLPLTIDRGSAVVTVPQGSGLGEPLRLVPDTGAGQVVLFAGAGRALPAFTPLDTVRLRAPDGQRRARRVLLDALDVGAVRLAVQPALVVDGPSPAPSHAHGLLPLHFFSRVTLNGPAGYLIVER